MIRPLLFLALAAPLLLPAPSALAAEMAFYVKNNVGRAVAVELYSRSRRVVWPGGDKVYLLEKGEKKSVPIECQAGEKICWGAWLNGNDGVAFGVGPDDARDCEACCTTCTSKTTFEADIAE